MPKCYRCQLDKPAEDFSPGNNRCRPCHKEYQAERRAKLSQAPAPDMTGTKYCSTCKLEKSKTEFGIAKGIGDGLQPQCKSCRKISRKNYNDSLKGRAKTLVRAAKVRTEGNSRTHDIDFSAIEKLYNAQRGLCAATGVQMVMENSSVYSKQSRRPDGPSIDRIDSSKGYELGNIQLTTTIYNSARSNWSKEDFLQLALSTAKLHGYTVTPLAPSLPTPLP